MKHWTVHSYAVQSLVVNDIFPPLIRESLSMSEELDYDDDDDENKDEEDSSIEDGGCSGAEQRNSRGGKYKTRRPLSAHCDQCTHDELQFRCDIEYWKGKQRD